jgi:hypothetical protein
MSLINIGTQFWEDMFMGQAHHTNQDQSQLSHPLLEPPKTHLHKSMATRVLGIPQLLSNTQLDQSQEPS